MFVEWSSTKHILFVQTSQFDWLSWKPKGSICILRTLVAMATESFHRLIMGQMKIGFNSCLIADI